MTGAGFAAGPTEHGDLRIEIRAVNGRGLSTKLRLPGVCGGYEAALEELLRQRLARGTVVLIVERVHQPVALPDRELVARTAEEMCRLADELRLARPSLAEVLQVAMAVRVGDASTSRPLPPRLSALVETALADLLAHREADGRTTVAAMTALLDRFAEQLAVVKERAPQLAERYRERLLQRVQEFAAAQLPGAVPAADVVREVALYADRIDVAEELQRLEAHLAAIRAVLGGGGETGRKLEFLLQELLRETNTMGSKSPDIAVTHAAVAMKTCIDRMKEQAANLE